MTPEIPSSLVTSEQIHLFQSGPVEEDVANFVRVGYVIVP